MPELIKIFRSRHEQQLESKYNSWTSNNPEVIIKDLDTASNGSEIIITVRYMEADRWPGPKDYVPSWHFKNVKELKEHLKRRSGMKLDTVDCSECKGKGMVVNGAYCKTCRGWGAIQPSKTKS